MANLLSEVKNKNISAQASLFVELFTTCAGKNRPQILLSSSLSTFFGRLKNLRFFNQDIGANIRSLPCDDLRIFHSASSDPLINMDRMATNFRISAGEMPQILVMPPQSLLQKIPMACDLQKHGQLLISRDHIKRDALIKSLLILGYAKVSTVIDRGTFAVRGSIIDIFANGEKQPVRIDLFGDEIESIKFFHEDTQRSTAEIESIAIGGVREIYFDDETKKCAEIKLINLADQLNFPTKKLNEYIHDIENNIHFFGIEKLMPAFFEKLTSPLEIILNEFSGDNRPQIIFDDRDKIFYELAQHKKALSDLYEQACIRGDLVYSPEEYFIDHDYLENLFSQFETRDIKGQNDEKETVNFLCKDVSDIRQDILKNSIRVDKEEEPHLLKPLASKIKKLHSDGIAVFICLSSRENGQQLKQLMAPFGLNITQAKIAPDWCGPKIDHFVPHIHAQIIVSKSSLAFGAEFNFLKLAVIAEDDIFGKRTKRKNNSGKQGGFKTTLSDLNLGDLVVHVDHGVGQFKGLTRLNMRGVESDFVLLSYQKDEKLYLPVHKINLIKPHGKSADGTLRLDKLGGTLWQSKKKKVKEAVMAMAQDLLNLYAKREVVERPPFIAPDAHFFEFESAFEFEPTFDQQKAIDDVVADMQKKQPMDRLVCGDVGYGKTEVAMRAAMLAVLSKRQVAILAPTTVLAQQHGITFTKRFANTGAKIAVVSRFQKASDIKITLKELSLGKIDIVIGTHRLLSPDVHFCDLGLIVVDEEQRFGIKSKEHLKRMRTKVDVLTMSATPIPRTLQMSCFGIRELSIIETPPVDRRAIQTSIAEFDDDLIKEAMHREISRGGQVYFVHNRVQTIEAKAEYMRALVPEAKVAVAHGQMTEKELEHKMLQFMNHDINVLVCTTIIETGIDVSTANTMFIDDADEFGLSQLYQLRGRIGRSKDRAFAYLLTSKKTEDLSSIAKTRLEILHKFSELGAGFRIAQHDLEIRGAGDLLGKNQHGHMAAVGYDLYAELLAEAVKELKGNVTSEEIEPEVILPMSALISEKYCQDLHERLTFYQRLASANNKESIDNVVFDLEDLYGDAPPEVLALKVSCQLKLALKNIHALRLEIAKGGNTEFTVGIILSPKTSIDTQKLANIMKGHEFLKITPQQKVIQTIKNAYEKDHEAVYFAGLKAIENIKAELLVSI